MIAVLEGGPLDGRHLEVSGTGGSLERTHPERDPDFYVLVRYAATGDTMPVEHVEATREGSRTRKAVGRIYRYDGERRVPRSDPRTRRQPEALIVGEQGRLL